MATCACPASRSSSDEDLPLNRHPGRVRAAGMGANPRVRVAVSATCDDLSAFVDGELDAARAQEFRLHVGECGACSQQLNAAMQVWVIKSQKPRATDEK